MWYFKKKTSLKGKPGNSGSQVKDVEDTLQNKCSSQSGQTQCGLI